MSSQATYKNRQSLRDLVQNAGEIHCISFDYFDTLAFRPCLHPTDLFYRLHREAAELIPRLRERSPQDFVQSRIRAEAQARTRVRSQEATLAEIHTLLAVALGLSHSEGKALLEQELAVEAACLRPTGAMVDLLEEVSSLGLPWVITSDTYFSAEQLQRFHQRLSSLAGVTAQPKAIYSSSDHRCGKWSHDLFGVVLRHQSLRPAELLHIGDNPHADVAAPRAQGIHALHIPRSCGYLEEVQAAEEALLVGGLPPGPHADHDGGLAEARRRVILRMESAELDHDESLAELYGALTLGPIFAFFFQWIADEISRHGLRQVFCFTREGFFFAEGLNLLMRERGLPCQAVPLHASRHGLMLCSLADSLAPLHRYHRRALSNPSCRTLAQDLGISDRAILGLLGLNSGQVDQELSDADLDELFRSLEQRSELREAALRRSAERRRHYIAHLERIGFDLNGICPVADLGWGGSIQAMLANVLAIEGHNPTILGLYLGSDVRILEKPSGFHHRSFLWEGGEPVASFASVSRSPEIFELATTHASGSFREVNEAGDLVCGVNPLPRRQIELIERMQAGILAYLEEWLRLPLPGHTHHHQAQVLQLLRRIALRAVETPTRRETRMLVDWMHEENAGGDQLERLIGSEAVLARRHPWNRAEAMALTMKQSYWPQLLLAAQSDIINPPPAFQATPGLTPQEVEELRFLLTKRVMLVRLISFLAKPLRLLSGKQRRRGGHGDAGLSPILREAGVMRGKSSYRLLRKAKALGR